MVKRGKEVSDRVVIILVIVAVVVSIVGTYLVYTNATDIAKSRQQLLIQENVGETNSEGQVGLVVNPQPREEGEGGG